MRFSSIFVAAGLVLLLATGLSAQVPQKIGYQGKITGSAGTCLDTSVQMVFSIYDDPFAPTYLWRETQPDVSIEKGVFNVQLGDYTTIPSTVFDGNDKYLGIKVGNDSEMQPRKRITSTGYAYRSLNTDVWDTHHWGDTYPTASNADIWYSHHWGDNYPAADIWDGHHWGETYPSASNSDLVDGLHGTQFLRSDVGGIIYGWLGIGTVPGKPLHVYNSGSGSIIVQGDQSAIAHMDLAGNTRFLTGLRNDISSGNFVFYSYGSNWVFPNGNVGIHTTGPGYPLDVAGSAHASSFPTSSDMRLKTDIKPLSHVLEKLDKLRGVSFEWNDLYESMGRSTGHREIGVVVQEVEAVFPELVTTWGDKEYRAVDYGRLTAVLIEAVKELRAENTCLKERIEKLEEKK